jgi:sterol desaturase/sphingolipid hydroxylase (fatty acid hydroxylase superfamily)
VNENRTTWKLFPFHPSVSLLLLTAKKPHNLSEERLIELLVPIFLETTYFAFSVIFYWMDNGTHSQTFKKFKLPNYKSTEIEISKIILVVVRNHLVLEISLYFCIPHFFKKNYSDELSHTILWCAMAYLFFDLVFYSGHYLMHRIGSMKFAHVDHHKTFTDVGFSGFGCFSHL